MKFFWEVFVTLFVISQVLGHDSVETTLRFYIHASANAEQRIGAMMNARWTS